MGTSLGPRQQAEMTERGSFGDLGLVKQILSIWRRPSVRNVVTGRVPNGLYSPNHDWLIVGSCCPVESRVDPLDKMNATRRGENSIQTLLLDGIRIYWTSFVDLDNFLTRYPGTVLSFGFSHGC